MIRSSSFHVLNADKGLSATDNVVYRASNAVSNFLPECLVDPLLERRRFHPRSSQYWQKVEEGMSPSRTLTDLFLASIDWGGLAQAMGGKLHVVDIGCGSGIYFDKLRSWCNEFIASYTGVDLARRDTWTDVSDPRASFVECPCVGARRVIPSNTNVFLTVSALEHFDGDLTLMSDMADLAAEHPGPFVHLHFVPPASGAWVYPQHGIRQYTPRKLSKMSRLFESEVSRTLWALGGCACNQVHADFVHRRHGLPERRLSEPSAYMTALRMAIEQDAASDEAAFYALVLTRQAKLSICQNI